MEIGKVSNQSSRLVAILKVLGIYLLTLLLLIWIFSFNKKSSSTDPSGAVNKKLEAVTQDSAKIGEMVRLMDTIADITRKLIELDKQELLDPGSAKADIEGLDYDRKSFYANLLEIEVKENKWLITQKERLKNIYDVLVQNREKLKSLNIQLQKEKEDAERKLNDTVKETEDSNQSTTDQLSSQLDDKASSLQGVQDELKTTQADLKKAKEDYDKLKTKNKSIIEQVKGMSQKVEEEKLKGLLGRNWGQVIDVIYPTMKSIELSGEDD